MKKTQKGPQLHQLVWQQEQRTLSLEGEPVLSYHLSWPEPKGTGRFVAWLGRYYARLAAQWRGRWQREVYIRACLDLVQQREASRPFQPWTAQLEGQVTYSQNGLLSLRMEAQERTGAGKLTRGCFGDVWRIPQGAPCQLQEFIGGGLRWKRHAWEKAVAQGNERRAAGDCFLDTGWEKTGRQFFPATGFWLTPTSVEFALPQCAVSPAAEGTPIFSLPWSEGRPEDTLEGDS